MTIDSIFAWLWLFLSVITYYQVYKLPKEPSQLDYHDLSYLRSTVYIFISFAAITSIMSIVLGYIK